MIQESLVVSDRTRYAVQDFTALNCIIGAIESLQAARIAREEPDEWALQLVAAFLQLAPEDQERVRLRLNCPLGRRAAALGMLRQGASTRAGLITRPRK